METSELTRLINLAMTDASFQEGLKNDPQATLQAHNFNLSAEQVDKIKSLDHDGLATLHDDNVGC